MATRTTDMRREVIRVDPNYHRDRRRSREYIFANNREFFGDYDERGAYVDADEIKLVLHWGDRENELAIDLWGDLAGQGNILVWGDGT